MTEQQEVQPSAAAPAADNNKPENKAVGNKKGGAGVVLGRHVTLEDLARGEHDLVGCLAPAAAPTHAIRHDAQHAARNSVVT